MDADAIVEFCTVLGLNYTQVYHPYGKTEQMSISCPLAWDKERHANGDLKPSCSVTVEPSCPSVARCHTGSCAYKGSLRRLIRLGVQLRHDKRTNKDLLKLLRWVREIETYNVGRVLEQTIKRVDKLSTLTYEDAIKLKSDSRQWLPESALNKLDTTYHAYAAQREISPDSWDRWGVRFDAFKSCLTFPVRDHAQKLVGLVGRAVSDSDPDGKKNYPGLDKTSNLFGAHLLQPGVPVIIVEGPIDCVRSDAALALINPVLAHPVATLGEGFSDKHRQIIMGFQPPAVYLFMDGDRAGELMAAKIIRVMARYAILYQVHTPQGTDPGALPLQTIRELFLSATKLFVPPAPAPRKRQPNQRNKNAPSPHRRV